MFLQPKRSKFKKIRKGKLLNLEFRANKLKFGTIGLKAKESGTISARQLEASRQAIVRKINRKGKLWQHKKAPSLSANMQHRLFLKEKDA